MISVIRQAPWSWLLHSDEHLALKLEFWALGLGMQNVQVGSMRRQNQRANLSPLLHLLRLVVLSRQETPSFEPYSIGYLTSAVDNGQVTPLPSSQAR